jgi:hypothetical protein
LCDVRPYDLLCVNALNKRRKHPRPAIRATGGEQHAIRVPIDGQDGRPERFLQMLGRPPVVFLVKRTNGDGPSAVTDGELVFVGAPLDARRGTVDSEEDENGLPFARGFVEGPDVGVSVLGTGDDSVGARCPGDGGDGFVVLRGGVSKRLSDDANGFAFCSSGISNGCHRRA